MGLCCAITVRPRDRPSSEVEQQLEFIEDTDNICSIDESTLRSVQSINCNLIRIPLSLISFQFVVGCGIQCG